MRKRAQGNPGSLFFVTAMTVDLSTEWEEGWGEQGKSVPGPYAEEAELAIQAAWSARFEYGESG